jgi:DNA-binding transcriptional ArsR family regulator
MAAIPPTTRLTDPRALRAYAHPIRLALVALLRAEGPQTATQAAAAIGESVPSCSFHLRQLAKYGVIEQADGGHGREKPWRARAPATEWEPGQSAAADALGLALAEQYFELTSRWLRTRHTEPEQWQEAALFGDSLLHLTAAELRDLGAESPN